VSTFIDDDFYGTAQGIIVMYDVNDQTSFANVRATWLEDFKKYASPDVVVGLVGNKADTDMLYRRVTPIDGRELALDYDIPFFWETSATENMNIQMVFSDMARKIALTYLVRPTVSVVDTGDDGPTYGSLKQQEMSNLNQQQNELA
jgi:GTPase SAR1 family protein